jgi:hypothetical protein
LAVAFDGLSTAASIRIGWDGQQVKTRVLYDRWSPSSRESLPLDWVAAPVAIPGGTLAPIEWTCYRTALTDLEIMGLDPPGEWKDWDEETEAQQQMWREHYARRIDPELRYLRESLLFYAGNYSEKWRDIPTTPTIASEPWLLAWIAARMDGDTEVFPRGIGEAAWEAVRWDPNAEARLRLAEAIGSELAPSIALTEVRRQWRCLTEAHPDAAELSDERLQSISSAWIEHRWSRSWLLSELLGSSEWRSIAIDSQR